MNNKFFFIFLFLFSFLLSAQEYWKLDTTNQIINKSTSSVGIQEATLDIDKFKSFLGQHNFQLKSKGIVVYFPNEKNQLEAFHLEKAAVLSPELESKYPNIQTYKGKSLSRSNVSVRLSVTPLGLSNMMRTPETILFMQPKKNSDTKYIYYERNNQKIYKDAFPLKCTTPSPLAKKVSKSSNLIAEKSQANNSTFQSDQTRRTFRLAVAGDEGYTSYWGNMGSTSNTPQENAYAALVNSVNRMNEVFGSELNIRFQLVTDASYMLTAATTPDFPESNTINQNIQSLLTNQLGGSNYDIGHYVLLGAANGNAGSIGGICIDNVKGAAFTQYPFSFDANTGGVFMSDHFDIDYFAHELGHQLGGTHTFAYEVEGTNVNSEPGSGSTIMAYAGITGDNNIQLHSDVYFHHHSLNQIFTRIVNICGVNENISNNNPPLVDVGENVFIPKGTAYELEATATDPDGDTLYYCWEQLDSGLVSNENFGSNIQNGSQNRSLKPTLNNVRTIPNMTRVLSGNLTQTNPTLFSAWETISNVGRTLRWGTIVRDRNIASDESAQFTAAEKNITVVGTAGPFRVTSQSESNETWYGGTAQTIRWDVSNTNINPISANKVSIYLSTDGGTTFSKELALDTENDGETLITVPFNISSTQCRIKVINQKNKFFAVNATNFKIVERDFGFSILDNSKIICDDNSSISYSLDFQTNQTLSNPVNFSISGLPSSVNFTISPNAQASISGTKEIRLENFSDLNEGNYSFIITGSSQSLTITQSLSFSIFSDSLPQVILNSPPNNDSLDKLIVDLDWSDSSSSQVRYTVELSESSSFNNPIVMQNLLDSKYTTSELNADTTYYWRVLAITTCSSSSYSSVFKFKTGSITQFNNTATGLPIRLNDAQGSTSQNVVPGVTDHIISIDENLLVENVEVAVSIRHTFVGDLTLELISPSGVVVTLSDALGNGGSNYTNTIFSNSAPTSISNATVPFRGTFRPIQSFDVFNNTAAIGDWTFRVTDNFTQDSGFLDNLELRLSLIGFSEADTNTTNEVDTDNDSILDINDNCPLVSNQIQGDMDGDGEGDLCDYDSPFLFTISKKNVSCISSDNGSIFIESMIDKDYSVSLVGSNQNDLNFTFSGTQHTITDLSKGIYVLCISSQDSLVIEGCFTIQLDEPNPLTVETAKFDNKNSEVELELNGSESFIITLNNGSPIEITTPKIKLPLEEGLNKIVVQTNLSCQEKVVEYFYVSDESTIYPNPVQTELNVLVGGKGGLVEITIFDISGNVVLNKSAQVDSTNRKVPINVSNLKTGHYLIQVNSDLLSETMKFIKK